MSFLGFIILGIFVNALVFGGGVVIYKMNKKNIKYTPLLIVNVILALLAFIYGFTAGFGTLADPFIVQSIGVMSFGMFPFCSIPMILLIRNLERVQQNN